MPKLNCEDVFIEIPRSKFKLSLLLVGSICFEIGGWFLVKNAQDIAKTTIRQSASVIFIVGSLWILFAIVGIGLFTFQLIKTRPGLIIDITGITILGLSSRHINWSDISEFKVTEIYQANLINVCMADTEGYIEKQKSRWQKRMMLFSYRRYGAPLSLTTNDLNCDFDDLYELLTTRLKEYKEAAKDTHYKSLP